MVGAVPDFDLSDRNIPYSLYRVYLTYEYDIISISGRFGIGIVFSAMARIAITTSSLILICLIVIFPILYTGYISLTNMNVYHWFTYDFIGIENYKETGRTEN